MPPSPPPLGTISSTSPPTPLHTSPTLLPTALTHLSSSSLPNFRTAITTAFSLPPHDTWTYHATAAVTLPQVQAAIEAGDINGLHDWYVDSEGKFREWEVQNGAGESRSVRERPSRADVDAYLSLFDPSKDPAKTLKGFLANAKRGGVRQGVAAWLSERRFVAEGVGVVVPKWKREKRGGKEWWNPYADFLGWACRELEWCGPDKQAWRVGGKSHHILPVLMHHFGCVCPTFEALGVVRGCAVGVAGDRKKGKGRVLDVGCGNGYWSYMLRQEPWECEVVPVDNGQSSWRSTWVGDTLVVDAVAWLRKREAELQREEVLLLVYPVTAGEFTASVIKEFKGDVVCVVGTQNGSGYTGFKGEMVDQWFEREMKGWKMIARVPVMSFPGKDDALFVFKRTKEKASIA